MVAATAGGRRCREAPPHSGCMAGHSEKDRDGGLARAIGHPPSIIPRCASGVWRRAVGDYRHVAEDNFHSSNGRRVSQWH
jgi:hypothetical protein